MTHFSLLFENHALFIPENRRIINDALKWWIAVIVDQAYTAKYRDLQHKFLRWVKNQEQVLERILGLMEE